MLTMYGIRMHEYKDILSLGYWNDTNTANTTMTYCFRSSHSEVISLLVESKETAYF